MRSLKSIVRVIYRNLANGVSILGVLPLGLLFLDGGYDYLIPLMIYNNVMDDLDGIVAKKLNIQSRFGAVLDNFCDGIAHILFIGVVCIGVVCVHHDALTAGVGGLAAIAVLVRVITRIRTSSTVLIGTPTNELIRHMLFSLLLADLFGKDAGPFLLGTFALHTVSMLVPFPLPWLIRSLTKSSFSIFLVNLALFASWLVPNLVLPIAACFILTYMVSFVVGGFRWLQKGAK